MFIIETVNGEVYVEGADKIENWDDLPKDIVIDKVSISDGRHVIETLTGFDYYVVCQEATARLVVSTGKRFSYRQTAPTPNSQILWGIKSTKPDQQRARVIFESVRAEPLELYTHEFRHSNLYLLKAYHDLEKGFRVKFETMLAEIETSEVVKVTLSIAKEKLGAGACNQGEEFLRVGLAKPDFELTDGRIREYLEADLEEEK